MKRTRTTGDARGDDHPGYRDPARILDHHDRLRGRRPHLLVESGCGGLVAERDDGSWAGGDRQVTPGRVGGWCGDLVAATGHHYACQGGGEQESSGTWR